MGRVYESYRYSFTKDELDHIEYLLEEEKRQFIASQNWGRVDSTQATIDKLKVNSDLPPVEFDVKLNKKALQKTYTSNEVMEIMGFSKSYLDKLCYQKKITYHTFEGKRKRYFFEDDLISFQRKFFLSPKINKLCR